MSAQCCLAPGLILAAAAAIATSSVGPAPSTLPVSSSTLYCMRSSVVGCNHGSKRAAETCSEENYVHQRRHSAVQARAGDEARAAMGLMAGAGYHQGTAARARAARAGTASGRD